MQLPSGPRGIKLASAIVVCTSNESLMSVPNSHVLVRIWLDCTDAR